MPESTKTNRNLLRGNGGTERLSHSLQVTQPGSSRASAFMECIHERLGDEPLKPSCSGGWTRALLSLLAHTRAARFLLVSRSPECATSVVCYSIDSHPPPPAPSRNGDRLGTTPWLRVGERSSPRSQGQVPYSKRPPGPAPLSCPFGCWSSHARRFTGSVLQHTEHAGFALCSLPSAGTTQQQEASS